MRTTISIDEDLLDELMQAEGVRSRSEAIRRAWWSPIFEKSELKNSKSWQAAAFRT
ncbi:MAG: CopG family ribbon-helix-helix protein [Acidobacteriota bacterium]